MSRGKLRGAGEVCADCGAADPSWASVNRGILVCDECCSIHRSLGRHISQVKSLRKGSWNPTLLSMVHTLYNNGANSIWEHSLLDPTNAKSGRRKPSPKDLVHPTKADFIRAKHQMLAFVYRPGKDENHFADGDVSKQLHSSVRTANLETSLRLLSLGADPNFFHSEKGNCPVHVAAKAGQASQVELLVVYGADPGYVDGQGKTPADYARASNFNDLADRLTELQYEVTDRLAYYLCGRKPDHQTGQHFIIPEMADSLDMSELAKAAKKKLQALPNNLFEELGMDVYDEVDRRETDAIWLSTQNQSALVTDRCAVPFLPVNPEFSSTRNQGRQKLARFNAREFATLIIDFLSDAKRRQLGLPVAATTLKDKESKESIVICSSSPRPHPHTVPRMSRKSEVVSDDEPLYDSVASDEDSLLDHHVGSLEQDGNPRSHDCEKRPDIIMEEAPSCSPSAPLHSCATGTTCHPPRTSTPDGSGGSSPRGGKSTPPYQTESVRPCDPICGPVSLEAYFEVKQQLATSQAHIQQLLQNNNSMKQEISLLQSMLQKLMHENTSLRTHVQGSTLPNGHEAAATLPSSQPRSPRSSPRSSQHQRPQSMYEPRDQLRQHQSRPTNPYGSPAKRDDRLPHNRRISSGDYDNTIPERCSGGSPPTSTNSLPTRSIYSLPTQSEVVKKTEQITKRIQELLISAQEGKHESFIPCSEKIYGAVLDMASIFPQDVPADTLSAAVRQLTTSALRLQTECRTLLAPTQDSYVDYRFVTQQVIQCAYDIAKAAKQLVTIFQ